MRSFILMLSLALLALVSAIPITPSAPPLRKRAEQYRLQGLREFEIAERLTTPVSALTPFDPSDPTTLDSSSSSSLSSPLSSSDSDSSSESRMLNLLHLIFTSSTLSADSEGDIAPGTLSAPQMLPSKAPDASFSSSWWGSLCALVKARESSFGYEGKEEEMRRPSGSRHWKGSFGGFRR